MKRIKVVDDCSRFLKQIDTHIIERIKITSKAEIESFKREAKIDDSLILFYVKLINENLFHGCSLKSEVGFEFHVFFNEEALEYEKPTVIGEMIENFLPREKWPTTEMGERLYFQTFMALMCFVLENWHRHRETGYPLFQKDLQQVLGNLI